MLKKLILLFSIVIYANAENAQTIEREDWQYNDTKTLESANPTNLKYFKYFESLPDEINLKIFENQDLSHLEGKKLVVGYGVADKEGNDCKIFYPEETGQPNPITVCLPWWRIEREYKRDTSSSSSSKLTFIDKLKVPKAPLTISYCKKYSDGKVYPGGTVTCTTYYDRNAGGDCWENPEQEICYVDNCADGIKDRCDYIDTAIGVTETLPSSVLDSTGTPTETSTKTGLATHRYECPAGPLVDNVNCVDEENVIIYPYTCKEDDPNTEIDDGEYIYCDESRPVFDASGSIEAFLGTCSDGSTATCYANKFNNVTKVCTQPIYETNIETELKSTELTRTYQEKTVDVLSGEPDIYSADENCLRSNTIADAREQQLYVKIVGSGSLDDDIYVLRHKTDGTHAKVYCNMQHNENHGSRKSYNGDILQCIDNNGSYSFNQTVNIEITDIVTVQQNSENENATGTPFAIGRNHYNSTKVTIDGIEVAPNTKPANFPYYPRNGGNIRTWDNANATMSILFPFAGAYQIYYYNKNNEEMAETTLNIEDFKEIAVNGSIQLKLGRQMKLAPGMPDDIKNANGSTTKKANREDMWVEWGGGVFGGKDSKTGEAVNQPNDSYVKDNAITKIIIKDLLTGAIVPIPLTYPLPYANRIFAAKLKVYEYRKYRCYDDFPEFNLLGQTSETRYVCSATSGWNNYINGISDDVGDAEQWTDESLCQQNCRNNYTCSAKTESGTNGFTCSQRGGEDLGGDLGGNFFSDKDTCDAACWTQNSCEAYAEGDCSIVEEQLSNPVSDWTGKTLFKKKSVTYDCKTRVDNQIGCAKYDMKVTEGDLTYNFGAVGIEEKDYSESFEDALVKAQMLEVGQQHIFSGWAGKCVQGMKWDFSYLGDPMTIMSYAMSAYSSMNYMAKLNPDGWAASMKKSFDTFTQKISDGMDTAWNSITGNSGDTLKATTELTTTSQNTISFQSEAAKEMSIDTTKTASQNYIDFSTTTIDNAQNGLQAEIESSLNDMLDLPTGTLGWDNTVSISGVKLNMGDYIDITQGRLITFGFKTAMALAAPDEEDYITADKLLQGYSGINANDTAVHNYNACMASIGASLPNLVGWSADSVEYSSEALIAPWQHPLRMTPSQIASIATVKGEKFVTSQYMTSSEDNILLNVIAITPEAYLQATQTICMGENVSKAATQIQYENNSSAPSSGANVGLAIAKAALSMACPPCGFAATIVMDLYNNVFTKVDTCNDEEDAIQWDMLDFKTNKFLNKEQCHYVTTECDKKVNFGFSSKCVRERKEYCCYDQITTKIFAEGIKAQTYAPTDKNMWKSCNDISVDELKTLNFSECMAGQTAYVDKCIPTDIYSDFQQTLFRQAAKNLNTNIGAGLIEQATDSMAITKANN